MLQFKWILYFACLIYLYSTLARASENQVWPGLTIAGTFPQQRKILYVTDAQAQLSLPPSRSEQLYWDGGLGYQAYSTLSYWLGYSLVSNRSQNITGVDRKNRLWQQLFYTAIHSRDWTLNLRSRLEETVQHSSNGVGIRFRQLFYFLFPFPHSKIIRPEITEEIFFNLTRPAWIDDNSVIDQNRFFLGVLVTVSSQLSFDLGYLDQYQVETSGNTNTNILYANMNINL